MNAFKVHETACPKQFSIVSRLSNLIFKPWKLEFRHGSTNLCNSTTNSSLQAFSVQAVLYNSVRRTQTFQFCISSFLDARIGFNRIQVIIKTFKKKNFKFLVYYLFKPLTICISNIPYGFGIVVLMKWDCMRSKLPLSTCHC